MFEFLGKLFSADFVPHGYCMRWKAEVVWLHVTSDALIASAYFLIPPALIYFVRKRRDLAFNWMFMLFGVFILACGATHLMSIWTLWQPVYRLDGIIKAITALASLPTAILLIQLMPKALKLPSPEQLRQEVEQRTQAEEATRRLNAELEQRVQERTAELKRSNEALQRIAYIAAHDLQEPIRMVTCYNQLLAKRYQGALDDAADEYIGFSVAGSKRMQELVNDLLTYATSLHDRGERKLSLADTESLLKTVMADLHLAITESAAVITADPLPTVTSDSLQLKQVLQNLIGNAIKYAKPGQHPRIHIDAEDRFDEWKFVVRDEGIGIDPRYSDYVFEPFKRLNPRYPGSGIGLALCKAIIEDHGGRIWVESKAGEGAAFYFTLPKTPPITDIFEIGSSVSALGIKQPQ
jgi:signal transduction histidine kinase